MRPRLSATFLMVLVLSACGQGDSRAQLRDACDSLIETARADPLADAETALADLRDEVHAIAEGSDGQTQALAAMILLAMDSGGSTGQAMANSSGACADAYDAPSD